MREIHDLKPNNQPATWLRSAVGAWMVACLISSANAEVGSYTVGIDVNCPAGLGE